MGKKFFSLSAGIRLTAVFLIIAGIGAGIYLISTQRIGTLPKAAPDTPTVKIFFEADAPVAKNKEFSLLLKLNPMGAYLRAFETYFSYDPAKVELVGNFLDDLGQAYNAEQGFFKKINPDREKNTVQVYGAKIGGEPISGIDDIELAKIRFKVKANLKDDDEISFRWSQETKIVGDTTALNQVLEDGLFALGTKESKPMSAAAASDPSPTSVVEAPANPVVPTPTPVFNSPPDKAFILKYILSNDSQIIKRADQNGDGMINTIDYVLILKKKTL